MKKISIVSPCYNEESNVKELYLEIKQILGDFKTYAHEIIFIDNASKDNTVKILWVGLIIVRLHNSYN